jgi:uncharacterized LabA/DUF88 family protein
LSKNVAIFIDVANLYYAARGQDVDVDYVALLKYATKGRDLIRAYAYSGLDPENENQRKFLDFLSKNGYKVVHKDIRKFGDGRVKANLDIELVVDLFRLRDRMDIAVVISGDGDFAPAIRALQDEGVRCEVISFRPNTSSDLVAVADEFIDIMKILGIGRKKSEKGVPMPEMPAKEVNPEFGFREASRGVAAAAMAALREGETAAPRPRRGRGARQAPVEPASAAEAASPEAAASEPVEPMTALEAHAVVQADGTDAEGRRRRRRRGGRGRGRGRRGEAQPEGVAELPDANGEIGWQEFDDLSELGELGEGTSLTDLGEPGEEREYAFSEADEATLAELGLASAEQAPEVAETEPMAAEAEAGPAEPAARTAAPAGRRRGGATRGGRRTARSREVTTVPEVPAAPESGETIAAEQTSAARAPRRRRATAAGTDDATTGAQAAEASPDAPAAPARRPRASRRRAVAEPTSSKALTPESAGARAEGSQSPRPRRRRAKAADDPSQPSTETSLAGPSADEEGIWQRFRSGRRTRTPQR